LQFLFAKFCGHLQECDPDSRHLIQDGRIDALKNSAQPALQKLAEISETPFSRARPGVRALRAASFDRGAAQIFSGHDERPLPRTALTSSAEK
jgi:hypothetical protein